MALIFNYRWKLLCSSISKSHCWMKHIFKNNRQKEMGGGYRIWSKKVYKYDFVPTEEPAVKVPSGPVNGPYIANDRWKCQIHFVFEWNVTSLTLSLTLAVLLIHSVFLMCAIQPWFISCVCLPDGILCCKESVSSSDLWNVAFISHWGCPPSWASQAPLWLQGHPFTGEPWDRQGDRSLSRITNKQNVFVSYFACWSVCGKYLHQVR